MKKYNFKARFEAVIDKMDSLLKKAMGLGIDADTLRHMDEDTLKMYKDYMSLYDETIDLTRDVLQHYDDLEDEFLKMREDQAKMIKMLEQLTDR